MTIRAASKGDVLTVRVHCVGIPCLGLNGGPAFKQTEAFSFQIATEDQEETDRYWNAIVSNGGAESQCGWCRDRWGLSWQITPRVLTDALAAGGSEASRAFRAMMTMSKIDVADHRGGETGLTWSRYTYLQNRYPSATIPSWRNTPTTAISFPAHSKS